jgi:hypothetical protein
MSRREVKAKNGVYEGNGITLIFRVVRAFRHRLGDTKKGHLILTMNDMEKNVLWGLPDAGAVHFLVSIASTTAAGTGLLK